MFVHAVWNAHTSALLREVSFYSVARDEDFYTCWQDKMCVPTREVSK